MGEASSHGFENAGGGSFGGTELAHAYSRRAIVAGLLIDVLTRLGGASQVEQQPAFLFGSGCEMLSDSLALFSGGSQLTGFPVPATLPDQSAE